MCVRVCVCVISFIFLLAPVKPAESHVTTPNCDPEKIFFKVVCIEKHPVWIYKCSVQKPLAIYQCDCGCFSRSSYVDKTMVVVNASVCLASFVCTVHTKIVANVENPTSTFGVKEDLVAVVRNTWLPLNVA